MLGEKIGEISGKVTMQRVLANLGGAPKMETSFQANGSLLGTDVKDTGTYWTVVRPDRTHYGEGQGVVEENGYKVCFAPVGKQRPTEFTATPGSGYILQSWARQKAQ